MVKHKGPKGPFLIIATILLISSCSTLPKSSFSGFTKNIKNASSTASMVINENKGISKKAFVQDVLSKEKSLNKIYYPFSGELEDPPYYYRFNKLKKEMKNIHHGLVKYAKTLEFIATGRDKEELKKLTSSSTSFLGRFTNDKTVGITTTAVYSSLKWMSKEKRKELLIETINKNQELIEKISNELVNITETLENTLHLSYDKYFYDLKENNKIEKAVNLSEKYKSLRNRLFSLKKFYSHLPEIHNNLKDLKKTNVVEFSMNTYSDYSSFK
jgi:hypothetical protein